MKVERVGRDVTISRDSGDGPREPVTAVGLLRESIRRIECAEHEQKLAIIARHEGRYAAAAEHETNRDYHAAEAEVLSRWSNLVGREGRERRLCPGGGVSQKRSGVFVAGNLAAGYASVFYDPKDDGTQYHLGDGLYERIDRHAFDNALRRKDDAACLLNHNPDNIVGRVSSGTMKLSVDSRGLKYTVDLPRSPLGENVKASINRGDIRGSSFAFIVDKQRFVRGTGSAPDVREILDVRLIDCSPVVFPAYTGTSSF